MLKLAFGLFILGCMASSLHAGIIPTSDGDEIKDWERYKDMILKKEFETEAREELVKKFRENYAKVFEFNHQLRFKENITYETKINEFSHLSHEEFKEKYLSKSLNETRPNVTADVEPPSVQLDYKSIPDSFDWRSFGLVSRVKHQGSCGSCWSFSNTGAVETVLANKYGQMIELSEQDLVDCLKSGTYANWGCQGGWPSNGFYYAYSKGLLPSSSAPYLGYESYCGNQNAKRYKITGYANIPYGDEQALKNAVATYGPVAVAIDASEWGFTYYSSGIYTSRTCSPSNNNHAVLVVGYGRENGQDYWIIKNSWGQSWGLNGYMKMARNKGNMCGIASVASYAYM